jgi:hypothetical protein
MSNYRGVEFNNTFKGAEPADYNACVGNNGHPSYSEYANGFSDAAVHLINIAIDEQSMDELIYPICFNMRHAIELRLKQFVFELKNVRSNIDLTDFKDTTLHNVGNIWEYFKSKSIEVDCRIVEKINEIDRVVLDFAEIDPNGQVFRYPYSTGNIKHLTKVSIINVVHLRDVFNSLRESLNEIYNFIKFLVSEYETGTYTNISSRKVIEDISHLMPLDADWKIENKRCKEIKREIINKFSISSNEFGRIKIIIDSHYEFSRNVGLLKQLKYSDLNDWLEFLNAYAMSKNHDEFDGGLDDMEMIVESITDHNNAVKHCMANISINAFIDIACVVECGRHGDYCEYYESLIASEIGLENNHRNYECERVDYISYHLKLIRLKYFIVKGLKMLGQDSLLASLPIDIDIANGAI